MDAHDLLAHLAHRDDEQAVRDLRATWAAFAEAVGQQRQGQPWRSRAACRGEDVNLFHRQTGASERRAVEVCLGCPVIDDCRQWIMAMPHHLDGAGIYGGLTVQERRALRRQREAEAA